MTSTNPPNSDVAVSAPGKVFLAGGYLVLDRKYQALVFGLDARIHVHVSAEQDTRQRRTGTVVVRSPQFIGAEWRDETAAHGRNPFVETTLSYVFTHLSQLQIDLDVPLQVTILADNDYYSQVDSKGTSADTESARFIKFNTTLPNAHKTGLGSSAALVTALTSALVAFFLKVKNSSELESHYARLHNLAQAAHCAAQGKVGSGFDVAAAVYGSILYRRFSPSVLENVGEAGSKGFAERLFRCVDDLDLDQKWDTEIHKQAVKIPQSLRLVMCDVDCGSQTPGMVKKVLQWRKEKPEEADLLWAALQQGTEDLCKELREIAVQETVGISDQRFRNLREIFLTIRSLIREMSSKSGVPIEPPVQTELLDVCSNLDGVVGGVVPGAGGYDAIALVIRNEVAVLKSLAVGLEGWKSTVAGATIGTVRLLGVKQETHGVRFEEPSYFDAWRVV
ncbi:MAG: hypothetical protein Q9227_002666 [Pyrenula ochraceoflavens]